MFYQVLSFNYKYCEQLVREKLAFNLDIEKKDFLKNLIKLDYIYEIYVLSTCNRVEIVTYNKDTTLTINAVFKLLAKKSNINIDELKNLVKIYKNEKAIYHIFSVVSSLDSLVLGESQITGQVKEAFKFSVKNGVSGKVLNVVISQSIKCAAEVRRVTNISKNPISIATISILQAQQIFLNLENIKVIVIGTGAMSKIIIKNLSKLKAKVLILARDLNKASILINKIDKSIMCDNISNLNLYIDNYPLLFSATSSSDYIINSSLIRKIKETRVWFDLAVPKDIEDISIDNLTIFYIDNLQKIAENNQSLKKEKLNEARKIVLNYQEVFYINLQTKSIEPLIKTMRLKVNKAIEDEITRSIKKKFIPIEYKNNITKMAQQMFNRFLHNPTLNMRKLSKNKENNNFIEIKKIFDI